MIHLVCGWTCLLPNTEAEVTVLGRPSGVHDLRSVAVPDYECVIDHRVRDAGAIHSFGGEGHVPEADNWIVIVSTMVFPIVSASKRRGQQLKMPNLRRRAGV